MERPDRVPSSSSADPQTPPPPIRQSKQQPEFASPFQVYTPPMRSPRTSAKQNIGSTADEPDELDNVITQLANEFALEDKLSAPLTTNQVNHGVSPQRKTPPPLSSSLSKRPQLRLKLEDMPTPQQAEDRAQRAANRLIAKREAMEKAMEESAASGVPNPDGNASATQNAILRMNFKSYSSGDDSDVQSPSGKNCRSLMCVVTKLQLLIWFVCNVQMLDAAVLAARTLQTTGCLRRRALQCRRLAFLHRTLIACICRRISRKCAKLDVGHLESCTRRFIFRL